MGVWMAGLFELFLGHESITNTVPIYGDVIGAAQGHPARMKGHKAREAARQVIITQAVMRAQSLAPIIEDIRAAGVHSYNGIAAQLDKRGIPTARGGRWAATQVRDILLRLKGTTGNDLCAPFHRVPDSEAAGIA